MSLSDPEDSLRRLLVSLPSNVKYDAESSVLKSRLNLALYFSLTKRGEYLGSLVTDLPMDLPSSYSEILEAEDDSYSRLAESMYKCPNYKHHGRPCARQFKQGEPIYRCYECGFDETCVMCMHCFNREQHRDHEVSISIASSSNDGICDCGDPQAWNIELHCQSELEQDDHSSSEVNPDFKSAIRETMDIILDYILDCTIHSASMLPAVQDMMKEDPSDYEMAIQYASDSSSLPIERYGVEDTNVQSWNVVLWNDEFHNYDEAIDCIQQVSRCSLSKGQADAQKINDFGFSIIRRSESLPLLIERCAKVEESGFTITILSDRDVTRLIIIDTIFDWLLTLLEISRPEIQTAIRESLCESLLEEFHADIHEGDFFYREDEYSDTRGLLDFKNRIPAPLVEDVMNELSIDDLKNRKLSSFLNEQSSALVGSRVQYFFYMDLRFWKKARKSLKLLTTSVLVSNLEYKKTFSEQFVKIYSHLLILMAKEDREWLLSNAGNAVVQLFTCPKTSLHLLQPQYFRSIIVPIILLFESYTGNHLLWERPYQLLSRKKGLKFGLMRSLTDLVTLITTAHQSEEHLVLFQGKNFIYIIMLFRMFQSALTLVRKEGEHITRESTEFLTYLQISYYLNDVIKGIVEIAQVPEIRKPEHWKVVETNIQILATLISSEPYKFHMVHEKQLIDHDVTKKPTSFINPLNGLLSNMLTTVRANSFSFLTRQVSQINFWSINPEVSFSDDIDYLKLSSKSLEAITLSSQIKIGHWIRNGSMTSKQAQLYCTRFTQYGYIADVHLNQLAILEERDDDRLLLNLLDRFNLIDWFYNDQDVLGTVFEERSFYLMNELVKFLYNMFSHRVNFQFESNFTEKTQYEVTQYILYTLCKGSLSFSDLTADFPISVEVTVFDKILDELAVYEEPKTMNDSGKYSIKKSYYKKMDPMSIYVDSGDFDDVSTAIVKELSILGKIKEENVVIEPQISGPNESNSRVLSRLKRFFISKSVVKLFYKLLQSALSESNETYVIELLHLLQAVLLDEHELYRIEDPVQYFIQIPVCDLLLSVVEHNDFSRPVCKKAEVLLNWLIQRDESIIDSLVDSFGEKHIENFKKSKGSQVLETKRAKKKRLAKERQEKIKSRFAKQQKSFMKQNLDAKKSAEHVTTHFPKDNEGLGSSSQDSFHECILCQRAQEGNEMFGIPAYVEKVSTFWDFQPKDESTYTERCLTTIENQMKQLHEETDANNEVREHLYYQKDTPVKSMAPISSRHIVKSCGHHMHYKCFSELLENSRKFSTCPLCRSAINAFVPQFAMKNDASPAFQEAASNISHFEKLNLNQIVSKYLLNDSFLKFIAEESKDQFMYLNEFKDILKDAPDASDHMLSEGLFPSFLAMSTLLGNTLANTEIRLRLSPEKIPHKGNLKRKDSELITSLLQCVSVISILLKQSYPEEQYLSPFLNKPNSLIIDFAISLLLGKEDSLQETIVDIYKQTILHSLNLLLTNVEDNEHFRSMLSGANSIINDSELAIFKKFVSTATFTSDVSFITSNEQSLIGLYILLEKTTTVYLKQLFLIISMCKPLDLCLNRDYENSNDYDHYLFGQLCKFFNLSSVISYLGSGIPGGKLLEEQNDLILKGQSTLPSTIEYPGLVYLVNLPRELNTFTFSKYDTQDAVNLNFSVCLTCGKRVKHSGDSENEIENFPGYNGVPLTLFHHHKNCPFSGYGEAQCIFLTPKLNKLTALLKIQPPRGISDRSLYHSTFAFPLSSPYLTTHGESHSGHGGLIRKAFLNRDRFRNLNELWLDGELALYISRSLGDSQIVAEPINPVMITMPGGIQEALNLAFTTFLGDQEPGDDDLEDYEYDILLNR
ncbi:hypothetical protein LJB42_000597 [Komagataella kurtzmanii]|nr:hypothetical protein LJB42_000597 [Komagataella kurtzmanii]